MMKNRNRFEFVNKEKPPQKSENKHISSLHIYGHFDEIAF